MLPYKKYFLPAAPLLMLLTSIANAADSGLMAYYPLNGEAEEYLKNNADGVLTGTTPTADRFGNKGMAIHFGRDCFIHIPTAGFEILGEGDFSFTFWFMASNEMSKPGSTIVRSITENQGRHGITFWFGDAEATPVPFSIGAEVWSAGQDAYIRNDFPLNDNQWHHAALIRSGSDVHFYLDGVHTGVTASPPLETPVLFDQPLILGNGHCPYDDFLRNRFVGALDDLRIYNRALSKADVTKLFTSKEP